MMNNDNVSLKDVLVIAMAIVIFVICMALIPSETVALFVSGKMAILGVKAFVSLVLAVISIFGVYAILNPKTAKQLMAEADKLALKNTIYQLKEIADFVRKAKPYVQSSSARESLGEICDTIEKLSDRYWSQSDVVGANQALNLFSFFRKEISEYLPIVKGETMVGHAKARVEIEDTEKNVIPMALTICQKLGAQKDESRLANKDIAHGTLEEMAASLGLLDDLNRKN